MKTPVSKRNISVKSKLILSLLLANIALFPWSAEGAASDPFTLPRAVPESEGVDSQGILNFLDAIEGSQHEFHSLFIVRHGKVISEGWWNPYRPDLKHMMYSVSKSFTSTAVGFAVSEKRLQVRDKVVTFFPEYEAPADNPFWQELTVKHLLTMSVGQEPDPSGRIWGEEDWAKAFFQTPIVKKPGSTFLYNSMATYMLSAIVTRVTGQKLIDYLRPRLFEPLGITDIDWETGPNGNNTGGWGLRIRTEGMARFGLLLLQKGMWNGKQILPAEWVEEATKLQILQNPGASDEERNKSDWLQGYGYKFWRCKNGGFRADGAYGQYIIVMPEQDAVIAITSLTPNMQGVLDLVWEHLLPAMSDTELPANESAAADLQNRLKDLALPVPAAGVASPLEKTVSGKDYVMEENPTGLESVLFRFQEGKCELTQEKADARYSIPAGRGEWVESETTRRGPSLTAGAKNSFQGLPPFKVAASFRWTGETTLELTLRYIESPHTETVTAVFEGNDMTLKQASPLLGPGMPLKGHQTAVKIGTTDAH
jgi:CubicO group peptidase (beta-lactamase class C family)